jgi:hypothetical protein
VKKKSVNGTGTISGLYSEQIIKILSVTSPGILFRLSGKGRQRVTRGQRGKRKNGERRERGKREDVQKEEGGCTLQRHNTENFTQIFPEKELCGLPNFHILWAIYIFPRSVCLFCRRKICGPILGIYKSLTDK